MSPKSCRTTGTDRFNSRGFAAEASVSALESLSTMSTAFKPYIEEDKVVTIEGDFVGEEHQF